MARTTQTRQFTDIASLMSNESLREIAAKSGSRWAWKAAVARQELRDRDRRATFGDDA